VGKCWLRPVARCHTQVCLQHRCGNGHGSRTARCLNLHNRGCGNGMAPFQRLFSFMRSISCIALCLLQRRIFRLRWLVCALRIYISFFVRATSCALAHLPHLPVREKRSTWCSVCLHHAVSIFSSAVKAAFIHIFFFSHWPIISCYLSIFANINTSI